MRLAKIYIFLFAMFFCTLSFARTPKDTDEFRNTTKLARELRIIIYRSDFEIGSKSIVSRNTSELVKQLKNCPQIGDSGAVATILALYKGYFTFQSSEIVQTVYDSITNSNCLTCFHYCDSMLTDNCWSYKDEKRGIYYPFYSYSYSHIILPILIESEFDSMANFKYQRYPHPNMYHYKHYPTAQILTELGLYDLAWRIYFETIWYSGEITFLTNNYYFGAANAAYRSGNKNLGWSFLALAAISDDEEYLESIMETAKVWIEVESGKKELPEQKILTGDKRKNAFLEIVNRYQEMNAHPRAWLFIQENKKEFDDADSLIKKVQDDWLEVVKMSMDPSVTIKCVMYGVELYPAKNDPLSIKIPWPFPEGSVEKLKAKIKEIADNIKEEEKNGYLNWNLSDSKLTVRAKYISCNDKEVIVENENGKKDKIAITSLSNNNKNYIYRRLAIRNTAIDDFCTLFHKWNFADKKLAESEAKYLSIDKENKITLQLKDGKKEFINLSDLNTTEQEYVKIWEDWKTKEHEMRKQKIIELKKQLLSEVKFRQWKSDDEYFNTNAKFISYNIKTQTVTIEKPDGKQTTMEFNDLCNEDKKYLKNLLNPQLPDDNEK